MAPRPRRLTIRKRAANTCPGANRASPVAVRKEPLASGRGEACRVTIPAAVRVSLAVRETPQKGHRIDDFARMWPLHAGHRAMSRILCHTLDAPRRSGADRAHDAGKDVPIVWDLDTFRPIGGEQAGWFRTRGSRVRGGPGNPGGDRPWTRRVGVRTRGCRLRSL